MGRGAPSPTFPSGSLKGVCGTSRIQFGRCNATPLGVREFSRTLEGGHSPLWLSVRPPTNPQNTCHLKPEWHRRPLRQPRPSPPLHSSSLAFRSSSFSPPLVCEESGTLKEKWIDFCSICSIWPQRQPSPCLTLESWKLYPAQKLLSACKDAFPEKYLPCPCPPPPKSHYVKSK